jgi:hypothetical protein
MRPVKEPSGAKESAGELEKQPSGDLRAPPKVMKNGFCSATSLSGSAPLPFVISTEAKRSGEISVWMLFLGNVFLAER